MIADLSNIKSFLKAGDNNYYKPVLRNLGWKGGRGTSNRSFQEVTKTKKVITKLGKRTINPFSLHPRGCV